MYKFSELSKTAQAFAYYLYCKALDDDLNRDDILSMGEYGAEADYIELTFDANGSAI